MLYEKRAFFCCLSLPLAEAKKLQTRTQTSPEKRESARRTVSGEACSATPPPRKEPRRRAESDPSQIRPKTRKPALFGKSRLRLTSTTRDTEARGLPHMGKVNMVVRGTGGQVSPDLCYNEHKLSPHRWILRVLRRSKLERPGTARRRSWCEKRCVPLTVTWRD